MSGDCSHIKMAAQAQVSSESVAARPEKAAKRVHPLVNGTSGSESSDPSSSAQALAHQTPQLHIQTPPN